MQIHHFSVQRNARYILLGNPKAPTRWLVLHGYGQLAPRFARKFEFLSSENRCLVVAEALNRFYLEGYSGKVGATWMTAEDRETDIADNIHYLNSLNIEAGYNFNAVFGFSQGVATLCRWLKTCNPNIHSGIFWAGSVAREMESWQPVDASALREMKLNYVVGTRDRFYNEEKINHQIQTLDRLQIPFKLHRFEGDHVIDPLLLKQLVEGEQGQNLK